MCCRCGDLLCATLEAVEGGLYSLVVLEVLEVLKVLEWMRRVLL